MYFVGYKDISTMIINNVVCNRFGKVNQSSLFLVSLSTPGIQDIASIFIINMNK